MAPLASPGEFSNSRDSFTTPSSERRREWRQLPRLSRDITTPSRRWCCRLRCAWRLSLGRVRLEALSLRPARIGAQCWEVAVPGSVRGVRVPSPESCIANACQSTLPRRRARRVVGGACEQPSLLDAPAPSQTTTLSRRQALARRTPGPSASSVSASSFHCSSAARPFPCRQRLAALCRSQAKLLWPSRP